MRVRSLICILAGCLSLAWAGTLIVQAQTQGLHERNALWESRTVIGMPGDDDDEGDDEGCDCLPYPAPVAATGQSECSDSDGRLIDCAGTGQDGEYQNGITVTPRFAVNGDGTVTDNLTGLIWLHDANCFWLRNWTDALSDGNTLADGSCGLTDGSLAGDWRLPNRKELQSLLDLGQYVPALPPGHPFFDVRSGYYWSSTSHANGEFYAWGVNINTADVSFQYKDYSIRVWPVRGPE